MNFRDSLIGVHECIAPVGTHFTSLEGQIPPHTHEIVDPKVQVYGDIGILTFHYRGSMADGKPLPKWNATVIYHYTASTWHTVHAN